MMLAEIRFGSGRRWTAAIAILFIIMGGCSIGRDRNAPMRLEVLRGTAQLSREGKTSTIRRSAAIQVGDRISLRGSALAELRLVAGRGFELSAAEVTVTGLAALSLIRGELLADVSSPTKIVTDGLQISATRSAFRIDKALSTRLGVYATERGVEARSGAGRVLVARLRQTIVAGGIPDVAKPLRLSSTDRWDRRYLQEAIDLDERLINFGRGLEAQLGDLAGAAFFQQVSPTGTDVTFLGSYLTNRRSDVLIGLSIAIEAKQLEGVLAERFGSVFGLWENQATWGLIAYEYGASSESIFSRLLEAIDKAGLRVVAGVGPGIRRSAGGGPPSSGGGPGPGSGNGPAPSPSPTRTPSPRPPVPSPISSVLPDPVEDPVNQVICGLIGAVCSP